jgi:predicted nuclease of restriction endonuclease-like (RecB) superfamily
MSRHSSSSSDIDTITETRAYHELIERLQHRIRQSQARAARTLNTELVMLYWSIGRDILDQQQAGGWGDGVVDRIADDLREATGGARGFSRRNLFYMRRFAGIWPDAEEVPSVMAQISWTAHRTLLDQFAKEPSLYVWYAAKTAENRWSVRHLGGQIHLKLHQREL